MEINEIQRLAAMGAALRPDWPARSLRTFIEKNLSNRAYGDVAVALAWICTRTKTDTPRLLLEAGAWWKATTVEGGFTPRPPKREEACDTCGRVESQHVGPWVGDHEFRPLAPRHYGDDKRNERPAPKVDAARTAMAQARADLCPCGVPRTHCADHREEATA